MTPTIEQRIHNVLLALQGKQTSDAELQKALTDTRNALALAQQDRDTARTQLAVAQQDIVSLQQQLAATDATLQSVGSVPNTAADLSAIEAILAQAQGTAAA